MPSNSGGRAGRTICSATAKLETCHQLRSCRNNHSLVDSAFLEHVIRSSRSRNPLCDGTIAIEYSKESQTAPWIVRFSLALPDGPTVLAHKGGPTLIFALRSLLVDDSPTNNPVQTWTTHSRTLCHAHMNNTCPAGVACNLSHSLFDPQMIVDLIARHGYPGRTFTMSYTDSADLVLGRKWQLLMTTEELNMNVTRPWREVSVVDANLNAAFRLLEGNVVSRVPLPPQYDSTRNATRETSYTSRIIVDPDLPPAYSPAVGSAAPAPSRITIQRLQAVPTSDSSTRTREIPPAYIDVMGGDIDVINDDDYISLPSPSDSPPIGVRTRRDFAQRSLSPSQLPLPPHPYYNRRLYDDRPGEFPWTAWEMFYWLSHAQPPRSRHNRLNSTYSLGLPPAPPVVSPDGWDRLDELDSLEILSGLGKVAVRVTQRLGQRLMQHFLTWRTRPPTDGRDLNIAVFSALQQVDRRLPYHHLSANFDNCGYSGSTILYGIALPALLWWIDGWLLRDSIFSLIRLFSWLFFSYVYPPIIPCFLVASLTHSRFLTSVVLCGLHPAATQYVFFNYITRGWVYSTFVYVAHMQIGLFIYYAILRFLGHPLYMAVFMRGLTAGVL
ncbi:uncharacterized protein PHACADRAFT_248346 [Phanerochaete carnosa HHB-10118-sp]|uniref:C3H1-type domain-containing protein n=1 Tax=Phanerochaete carnosa (strain HHB-10118-sp) TaxID=650164 RepID=K5XEW7_PHACS|nr:uncharacterized protein PHACADRAFT_248346 [Phanerochaete carnosa HHB-10118-sp]EKM61632.1 hypothetical protein PHACADRAFT_248346 [Phanerochaete carnosa HHB-10118-sp]